MKLIKQQEKIEKIKKEILNSYIVIDFDRTITAFESTDSWDAAGQELGQEFKRKARELYEKYRPIELDYNMDIHEKEREMEKWYGECMDLYYEFGLTKDKLTKSIEKSNLIFRKGAPEFLQKMHEQNIPVIILSAGIGNVIEQFLKNNNCYFENMYIISNFIIFNENGEMKQFNSHMIHTLNKTMKGHLPKEWKEKLENRKGKMLFGDLIEDKKMIEEKEWYNTIAVVFLNKNSEDEIKAYQENFDIVLTDEDATFNS